MTDETMGAEQLVDQFREHFAIRGMTIRYVVAAELARRIEAHAAAAVKAERERTQREQVRSGPGIWRQIAEQAQRERDEARTEIKVLYGGMGKSAFDRLTRERDEATARAEKAEGAVASHVASAEELRAKLRREEDSPVREEWADEMRAEADLHRAALKKRADQCEELIARAERLQRECEATQRRVTIVRQLLLNRGFAEDGRMARMLAGEDVPPNFGDPDHPEAIARALAPAPADEAGK
jgi:hypothetical protein